MRKCIALILSVVALGSFQTVQAQDDYCCEITQGFYVGISGGASWWNDLFTSRSDDPGQLIEIDQDIAYYVGGFIGYRFCNGIRLEGELGYRNGDVNDAIVYDGPSTGNPVRVVTSEVRALSYMANVFYDCSLCACNCCMRPYFGVGFGVTDFDIELVVDSPTIEMDDDDTVFCYQLIVGLAYPIWDSLDLHVEYRLMGMDEPSLGNTGISYQFRDWSVVHNFIVSLSWTFGDICCCYE